MTKTKTNLPTLPTVDISTLSTEDLEALLAQKKQEENEAKNAKRQQYENEREALITDLGNRATATRDSLSDLKAYSFAQLEQFRELLLEYGDIRGGEQNKGNWEIKNERFKIQFTSQVKKTFDERAELAEEKLKSFLKSFVKKKDKDIYDLVLSLLERNPKTGDFDISNIQRLYKLKDRFTDKDWIEAIELFQESYNPQGTQKYIRFYTKNEMGGWDLIVLQFSNV